MSQPSYKLVQRQTVSVPKNSALNVFISSTVTVMATVGSLDFMS